MTEALYAFTVSAGIIVGILAAIFAILVLIAWLISWVVSAAVDSAQPTVDDADPTEPTPSQPQVRRGPARHWGLGGYTGDS